MTTPALQRVEFRGVTLNKVTVQQLRLVEKQLGYTLTLYQGSYRPITSYSADTHHGGMAVDLAPYDWKRKVRSLREKGFAAWHRPAIKGVWEEHVHAILNATPTDASPGALAQIRAYKAGRDGLVSNLIDKTWRPEPIRTAHYSTGPTHLDVLLFQQNWASRKSGWTGRRKKICSRILAAQPDVVFCEELYAAYRPAVSRALKAHYAAVSINSGKVVYVRKKSWRKVANSSHAFHLPNGKDGAGAKIQHVATGKFLNVIAVHLSWQHAYGAQRTAEVKSLVHQAKSVFPHNHTIYGGDLNDALKSEKSRPKDSAGAAFAKFGYHDAEDKSSHHTHKDFNSANQFEIPAPKDGIHLDRVMVGGDIQVLTWDLNAYTAHNKADYESDHFGLTVAIRVAL